MNLKYRGIYSSRKPGGVYDQFIQVSWVKLYKLNLVSNSRRQTLIFSKNPKFRNLSSLQR